MGFVQMLGEGTDPAGPVFVLLYDLKFDLKILAEHIDCVRVFSAERHDDVRELHGRLNEIIVGRLHKATVLGEYVDYCAAAVCDVSADAARQSDVVRSQHENFEVH